jgi:hypothetical protein
VRTPEPSQKRAWSGTASVRSKEEQLATIVLVDRCLVTLQNYVGDRWIPSAATETLEVRNPATDEVLAHVPLGGSADERAVSMRKWCINGFGV